MVTFYFHCYYLFFIHYRTTSLYVFCFFLFQLSTDQYTDHDWFNSLLEDPVLNDKMITDAVPSPRITSEHSYSINNDQSLNSSIGALCKIDDFGKGNQSFLIHCWI